MRIEPSVSGGVLWNESVRGVDWVDWVNWVSFISTTVRAGGVERGKESRRTAIAPLKAWALLNMRVRDVTLERIQPPGPSKSLLNDDAP